MFYLISFIIKCRSTDTSSLYGRCLSSICLSLVPQQPSSILTVENTVVFSYYFVQLYVGFFQCACQSSPNIVIYKDLFYLNYFRKTSYKWLTEVYDLTYAFKKFICKMNSCMCYLPHVIFKIILLQQSIAILRAIICAVQF